MYKSYQLLTISLLLLFTTISFTKVEFVKIPEREELQLTIYTPELSLIQEQRSILLKKGINKIEFAWKDVLLDTTSLYFMPLTAPHLVSLKRVIQPEAAKYLIWEIDSKKEGKEVIKASYFIQGLSWHTKYFIFVDEAEEKLKLENYATINNRSGDEFKSALINLVLGEIHRVRVPVSPIKVKKEKVMEGGVFLAASTPEEAFERVGLAEYYIYKLKERLTIKDKETVETLLLYKDKISFDKKYYTDTVLGKSPVTLFYEFKNELDEPLPPGIARIFKIKKDKDLYLVGEDNIKYTPRKEEVKLTIGEAKDVIVEKKQIGEKRLNEKYDSYGNLVKYDIDKVFKITVTNRKKEKIKLFIKDRIDHKDWTMIECKHDYKKIAVDTIQFELELKPQEKREITYKVRLHY